MPRSQPGPVGRTLQLLPLSVSESPPESPFRPLQKLFPIQGLEADGRPCPRGDGVDFHIDEGGPRPRGKAGAVIDHRPVLCGPSSRRAETHASGTSVSRWAGWVGRSCGRYVESADDFQDPSPPQSMHDAPRSGGRVPVHGEEPTRARGLRRPSLPGRAPAPSTCDASACVQRGRAPAHWHCPPLALRSRLVVAASRFRPGRPAGSDPEPARTCRSSFGSPTSAQI
jgi:hypothetical protein